MRTIDISELSAPTFALLGKFLLEQLARHEGVLRAVEATSAIVGADKFDDVKKQLDIAKLTHSELHTMTQVFNEEARVRMLAKKEGTNA